MTLPASEAFDAVMGLVRREVWIVTAAAGGRRGGLTATWVTAASIDRQRPLMLAGLAANHFTAELVEAAGAFATHLLRPDQTELAWDFARDSGRERDKFAGLVTEAGPTGSPRLADCLGWLECRVVARLAAGERTYFWGEVVAGERHGAGTALTDHQLMQQLSDDRRQHLAACRYADIGIQRTVHDRWRATLPADLQP